MVLVLSDEDVSSLIDLETLVPIVADALVRQASGRVECPERPHYPVGFDGASEPEGIALAMPAYIHGDEHYGTKLVGVHEGNRSRNLPTVSAQIVLNEAETGVPVAVLNGTRITNARTACIGALAARDLAPGTVTVGVLGAGTQARWQVRGIAATTDVESVRVYSPSGSKAECVADLCESGVDATESVSSRDAIEGADVVVTATTSTEPVFPADALEPTAVVVAIGAYTEEMQELEPETFCRAGRVFGDVPEGVAGTGDIIPTQLGPSDITPLGSLFEGTVDDDCGEIVVVESVGSAVMDIATASALYESARDDGTGNEVPL